MIYVGNTRVGNVGVVEAGGGPVTPLVPPTADKDYLYFQAEEDGASVSLEMPSGWTCAFEYSTDGSTWNDWTYSITTKKIFNKITLNNRGNYVFIRAKTDQTPSTSSSAYFHFVLGSKHIACGGEIRSLRKTDPSTAITLSNYQFFALFDACSSLTTPPKLSDTSLASYCYHYMFRGCSSLKETPYLPATTLKDQCYRYMFQNCISLTSTGEIAFTTGASYGCANMYAGCTSLTSITSLPNVTYYYLYYYMFDGCTSLTNTCPLNAQYMPEGTYEGMFANCISLVTAPSINATTMQGNNGCRNMFLNCISLTTPPTLPITSLRQYCYSHMFDGCRSLVTPPELPATTLVSYCYEYMFQNCTSLTRSPRLLATAFNSSYAYCYQYMFNGCSSLSLVECHILNLLNQVNTQYWMNNVSSTGTFIKNALNSGWQRNQHGIPSTWTVEDYVDYFYVTRFTQTDSSGSIVIKVYGTPDTSDLAYSKDKMNWTLVDLSQASTTISMQGGDKLYLRSSTGLSKSLNDYVNITSTYASGCTCGGNIMTLIDYQHSGSVGMTSYGFAKLFKDSNINTGFTLPGNLNSYCYAYMFENCYFVRNITLPKTTLSPYCYLGMYKNSRIQNQNMPSLPATTLAEGCYKEMFYNCIYLTTPLELSANTLAASCYESMFQNCTGLTSCPQLNASTLAIYCYKNMFAGCTSITKSCVLNAKSLLEGCYSGMFDGCTGLNEITCMAETINNTSLTNWTNNVASSGTFICKDQTVFTVGVNGIPVNWTVQERSSLWFNCSSSAWTLGWVFDYQTSWGGGWAPEPSNPSYTIEYSFDNETWEIFDWSSYSSIEVGIKYGDWDQQYLYAYYVSVQVPANTPIFIRGNLGSCNESISPYNTSDQFDMTTSIINYIYDDNGFYLFPYGFIFLDEYCSSNLTDDVDCGGDLTTLINYNGSVTQLTVTLQGLFAFSPISHLPDLPSTSVCSEGYKYLFYNCSNLINANIVLPATTANPYMYDHMFSDCGNIVNGPDICLDLSTMGYQYNYIMSRMFQNCYGLSSVKVRTLTWSTYAAHEWLYGVSSTGIIYKPSALSIPADTESGVPSGWTTSNI